MMGGQGRDRTVDLPIFRRKRHSQLGLSGHTQLVGVSVWFLMGLCGAVESVHIACTRISPHMRS